MIKLAPVFKWFDRLGVEYVFVWGGQHYDYELSNIFFDQLRIPDPNGNLNVGSGTHAEQKLLGQLRFNSRSSDPRPATGTSPGDSRAGSNGNSGHS